MRSNHNVVSILFAVYSIDYAMWSWWIFVAPDVRLLTDILLQLIERLGSTSGYTWRRQMALIVMLHRICCI